MKENLLVAIECVCRQNERQHEALREDNKEDTY